MSGDYIQVNIVIRKEDGERICKAESDLMYDCVAEELLIYGYEMDGDWVLRDDKEMLTEGEGR